MVNKKKGSKSRFALTPTIARSRKSLKKSLRPGLSKARKLRSKTRKLQKRGQAALLGSLDI